VGVDEEGVDVDGGRGRHLRTQLLN
jgi:hypothetical protein